MSRDIWNPERYRTYAAERARPFSELLARVDVDDPRHVVDLGCGPGERTADLAARWPGARVEGVDSSARMIAEARGAALGARVRFSIGDLAMWKPDGLVDVIFSHAALQWVPGHQSLLPRWVDALASGGRLAFGMPGNFDAPSHVILRELCAAPRWRDRLAATVRHDVVSTLTEYAGLLAGLGCEVDAWETTYLQILPGPDPVLEWMSGTALRPVFDALPDDTEREEFRAELAVRLRAAYPRRSCGTVFPFRRIFVVARRPSPPPNAEAKGSEW
ncbi:trans-aconitate 2-methyltransferase [Actinoallomurus sp. NPDC050550]|uniref:trans-aconitate 2-methyltransferase n=1 Tax=Actinoallomurus sp. NPDC050550 TaxID=3154937 RepID=UPI0033BFF6F1